MFTLCQNSKPLTNNHNARQIAKELFANLPDGQDRFLQLYFRSKQGDEAAVKEAIAIIAFGVDEKIAEAFEDKENHEIIHHENQQRNRFRHNSCS